ncbi:unnamed protein product [Cuscuta campestris]|uniref:Uncharacterized protein n=1 Tax=Cuscuta campestris TaxID=132261 RepID=A0A484MLR2_9ASTE|nr:unnamed protein product [Cuscuta campestris]
MEDELGATQDVHPDQVVIDEERNMYESLLGSSKRLLYPGCTKFTRLKGVLELFNLKVANGWSDKSFTSLLSLLGELLPDGHELPSSTYEANKMMSPMDEGYKKIHACVVKT